MVIDLDSVVASDRVLLYLFNGLEAFGQTTAVQERYMEEGDQPVRKSCLPDTFKVVGTYSIEASFSDFIR